MQGNRQERRRGSYGESSSVPRKAEWDHVTKPKWGKVRRRSQVVKAKCISNCRMLVPEALWREQKEVRTWRRSRNHNFDVPHRILCGAWVSWLAVLRAMKRVKADITEIGEAKKKIRPSDISFHQLMKSPRIKTWRWLECVNLVNTVVSCHYAVCVEL